MRLETPRLEIRHFSAADAPALTRALNDPRIFTYLPEEVPELADIERLIAGFMQRDARNLNFNRNGNGIRSGQGRFHGTNFALVLKADGHLIGWCGLQPFEPYPDKIEIFYGLSPAYWHQGYATEAAKAVLRYGFETLRLAEIVAGVKPGNRASIRVLEKIGLVHMGSVDPVPAGAEWYRGERLYGLDRERYQRGSEGRMGAF